MVSQLKAWDDFGVLPNGDPLPVYVALRVSNAVVELCPSNLPGRNSVCYSSPPAIT